MMTKLKMMFRHNLLVKIASFVAAVFLWAFVMNEQNPSIERNVTLPVRLENAPAGYKITQDQNTVRATVRAPRSYFVTADLDDFFAYLDLAGIEDGSHPAKVVPVLPPGMEVISLSPEIVMVTLDRIVQKNASFDLIVTGSPAPGTAVSEISRSTNAVTLEGPSSAVAQVTRVIGYVGLSGNGADFSLNVPLTAINADGKAVNEVRVIPQSVDVSVQLARGLTKKIVSIKPVFDGDLPNGYLVGNVRVDPSKIEIAGEAQAIAQVTELSTEKISLANEKASAKKVVKLELPEGIIVTNKSVIISVEVTKKDA